MDAYYNDQTPAGWNGQFAAGSVNNSGNSADPFPKFDVLVPNYLHQNPGNSCDSITVADQVISAGPPAVIGKSVTGLPS